MRAVLCTSVQDMAKVCNLGDLAPVSWQSHDLDLLA